MDPTREPRSFSSKEPSAVKSEPIPPGKPLSLSLVAQGINQLHECMEDTKRGNQETHALVVAMKRDVDIIKATPIRLARWLGGAIAGAVVGLAVQNFVLHKETAQTANQAAQTAAVAAQKAADTDTKVTAVARAVGAAPP